MKFKRLNEDLSEAVLLNLSDRLNQYYNSDRKNPLIIIYKEGIGKFSIIQNWALSNKISHTIFTPDELDNETINNIDKTQLITLDDYTKIPRNIRLNFTNLEDTPRIFLTPNIITLTDYERERAEIINLDKMCEKSINIQESINETGERKTYTYTGPYWDKFDNLLGEVKDMETTANSQKEAVRNIRWRLSGGGWLPYINTENVKEVIYQSSSSTPQTNLNQNKPTINKNTNQTSEPEQFSILSDEELKKYGFK